MPTLYLHLRGAENDIHDPEGADFSDMKAAQQEAIRSAREIITEGLRCSGMIDLRYRIDVEDEQGTIVCSLPFSDAVEVLLPEQWVLPSWQ